MKFPRLPRKCNILEAKYSAQQMHEYAELCIKEHVMLNTPRMTLLPAYVMPAIPGKTSFIKQLRKALL